MTWAVTLDFHNTIACCDSWFELEVFDLVPAFLDWHAGNGGSIEPHHHSFGRERYREIRRQVMDSGSERDAAACLVEVLAHLEIVVADADIERGLEAIFRPTVIPAEPMPGVIESVQELRLAGVQLAVVSSAAYHPFLEWTLEAFGIRGCFEHVLTSAECGHYKSTPRIYELAAKLLERDPRDCIHIGDSERFDVISARNAGMRTVLVDWNGQHNGATEADLRLETLVDLPVRLSEAFGKTHHAV